jgi:hypothetical protein
METGFYACLEKRTAAFIGVNQYTNSLCGIPGDFHSVRALNRVSTMPAHPPNHVCRFWQTLLGVVATNLPGADLNSSAGPKGGGQDARNKDTWDATFHRLATKSGEKCGLEQRFEI